MDPCITDVGLTDLLARLMSCTDPKTGKVTTNVLQDPREIRGLLYLVEKQLKSEPNMYEIEAPLAIVGDIHGQYPDLMKVFSTCGNPPTQKYLFLGDYVDRGRYSLETICCLFTMKAKYPTRVYLLRGNHESGAINRVYGFYDECCERFKKDLLGLELWHTFQRVFSYLPLVARIGLRIICMHGGLSPELHSIDQLKNLTRPIDPNDAGLHTDLLWSDPDLEMPSGPNDPLFGPSERGISHKFNKTAVNNACKALKVDLIVRAHQVVQDGYEFFANRHMVTLFSAPNYCGEFNNKAAVMLVDVNHQCKFVNIAASSNTPARRSRNETDLDDIDALIDQMSDSENSTDR
uniref:Serine/threonine-protein phosphatase n=2 Tax=Panagrellus redivivus TaxID=6233 RepID=A0A7E4VG61_PANRE